MERDPPEIQQALTAEERKKLKKLQEAIIPSF
jgi:hypothetical protein